MRKLALVLIASIILAPVISFAQSIPQPPASWVAFLKQEQAKRAAFFQQMQADRQAFLNANPDVQAYLTQIRAANKARLASWAATHPRKGSPIPQPISP